MINPHQFVNLILEPALRYTGMYSVDAMYQMICTALVESKLTHLKQLPDGPALGLFQIEWPTALDCFRYLQRRTDLRVKILNYCERTSLPSMQSTLIADLNLNVLIARTKYWMQSEPIPSYKNPEAQAEYYKKYYNTSEGASTVEQFIKAYGDIIGWIPEA